MTSDNLSNDWIAWIDLETTGLVSTQEEIVEIAVIITDGNLRMQHIGPTVVIHQPYARLREMDQFVQDMHTRTGLWKESVETGTTTAQAEAQVLAFLRNVLPNAEGTVPLGGATISFDRSFLADHMPDLHSWLHYRNVDVTSFKEMWRRWLPQVHARMPEKKEAHRAQPDVIESIEALRFFKDEVMKSHEASTPLKVPF